MKKLLSLLLALMMLVLLPLSAWADVITVESAVLDLLDLTASKWYSTSEDRALLAACVITDVTLSDMNLATVASEALVKDSVYVGRNGNNLLICFWGNKQALICAYNPNSTGLRIDVLTPYMPDDPSDLSTYMEYYVISGTITDYYHVSADDVRTYISAILEVLF